MSERRLDSFSDAELVNCVAAPAINRVDTRKTTITGTFAKAIMPVLSLEASDIRETLAILGMTPEKLVCAYCGDPHSEWDHFRATARNLRATGFGTSSRNLVPACGKCNQSRGNRDWRKWIVGKAKLAPARRRPEGLQERIARLSRFEEWSEHDPIDFTAVVPAELLAEYWEQCDAIVAALARAQAAANRIRAVVKEAKAAPLVPGQG